MRGGDKLQGRWSLLVHDVDEAVELLWSEVEALDVSLQFVLGLLDLLVHVLDVAHLVAAFI